MKPTRSLLAVLPLVLLAGNGYVLAGNWQRNTYRASTNTRSGYVTVNMPLPPNIGGISVTGMTNVLLTGTGGPTNQPYYYWVLSATNLTLPLSNWSVLATNPFNADGSFSNRIPVTPGIPRQFYRLQLP